MTIVRPKDDLEHLLMMGFERGRNLVVQPPARPGVPMTNGPRRVVLITGASSGIGRATAELLATRGHRVFGGVRAPAMLSSCRSMSEMRLRPQSTNQIAFAAAAAEELAADRM